MAEITVEGGQSGAPQSAPTPPVQVNLDPMMLAGAVNQILDAREQRANSFMQQNARQAQANAAWQPPPDPSDPNQLLIDGNALLGTINQKAGFATNLAAEALRRSSDTDAIRQEIGQLRNEAFQMKAASAWERAKDILKQKYGLDDVESYKSMIDQSLRGSPMNQALQILTSPEALARGVKIIRDDQIESRGGNPNPQIAPSVGIGGRSTPGGSFRDDVLSNVYANLGLEVKPETRKRFQEEMSQGGAAYRIRGAR